MGWFSLNFMNNARITDTDLTKLEDGDGGGIFKDKAKDGLNGEDNKKTKES